MNVKQYSGIDVGKFLCAILVIAIHTEPFINNLWLDRGAGLITRLAVPFFFTATGYLLIDHLDKERLAKNAKRLIILYSIWSIIYLPFNWPLSNPLKSLLITGVNSHLWYIPALLFSVVVVFMLHKKLGVTVILSVASFFLVVGTLLSTYKPVSSEIIGGGGTGYSVFLM